MKKWITCTIAVLVIFPTILSAKARVITKTAHKANNQQQQQNESLSDEQIAQLAIASAAQIIQNMLTIGQDPENSEVVVPSLSNIVSTCAHFVIQAIKTGTFKNSNEDELTHYLVAKCTRMYKQQRT